jgi:hypothetical protein
MQICLCHLWPALLYSMFFSLSHKWHDFRQKKLLNIMYVFRVSLRSLSEEFFIIRITERDIIKNADWSSFKVSIILVRF